MKSIGEAIQYLHSINIAHRDVKVPRGSLLPVPPTEVWWGSPGCGPAVTLCPGRLAPEGGVAQGAILCPLWPHPQTQ